MSIVGGQSQELSLLQLISDPKRFQAQIDRYESARLAAEEKLAVLGYAEDMTALKKRVEDAQAKEAQSAQNAALQLARAHEQADAIIAEAERQAAIMRGQAESEAHALRNEAQRVLAEAEQKRSEAQAKSREAEERMNESINRERVLGERLAEAQLAQRNALDASNAYEARKKRLEEAVKVMTDALRG